MALGAWVRAGVVVAACAGIAVLCRPGAASADAGGLGLAAASSQSAYRSGEPVVLRWQLRNDGGTPCQASRQPAGTVTIGSVTRDGVPVPPALSPVSYPAGLGPVIVRRLARLPPGGTLSLDPVAADQPAAGERLALGMVSWSPTGADVLARWPVDVAGSYQVTASYTMPPARGLPADTCRAASTTATVHFAIAPAAPRSGLPRWLLPAAAAGLLGAGVAGLVLSRRRRRRRAGAGRVVTCLAALVLTAALPLAGARRAAADVVAGPGAPPGLASALAGCLAKFRAPGGDPAGVLPAVDSPGWTVVVVAGPEDRTWPTGWGRIFGRPSGAVVTWLPDISYDVGDDVRSDPCADLYHELAHDAGYAQGTYSGAPCDDTGISVREVAATLAENEYRAAQGLPHRPSYSGHPLPSSLDDCDKQPPEICADPAGCATSNGDPHLATFDGRRYDFQAVGEFVAVRSTVDSMRIQTRQSTYFNQRDISRNSAVTMDVGGDRVGFYADDGQIDLRLNGAAVTVGAAGRRLPHGGRIDGPGAALAAGGYLVRWPDGSLAQVRGGLWGLVLTVRPADRRRGRLAGLLGNFDGVPGNDLVTRDGTALPATPSFHDLYQVYGQSWRVRPGESLFDYQPGQDTTTFTDAGAPTRPVAAADLPNRAGAEALCRAAGVTDPTILAGCTLDAAVTGQADFVDSAVATQAARHAGGPGTGSTGSSGAGAGAGSGSGSGAGGTTGSVPASGTFPLAIGGTVGPDQPAGAGRITAAGQRQMFGFTATRGQVVYLRSNNLARCGDTEWWLLLPDGSERERATPGCGDLGRFVLPATGRYTVVVTSAGARTGTYGFTLLAVPPDRTFPIAIGDAVRAGRPAGAGILATPGERHRFTFTGTAGQHVTLRTLGTTDCALWAELVDPTGTTHLPSALCQNSGPLPLPTTGRYTITVYADGTHTGHYAFQLTAT